MRRRFVPGIALLVACLVLTPVVRAQAPQAQEPYKAVAVTFDVQGLSLLDAVRLTLEHDPEIKLRTADADYRAGVLRTESGRFDMLFHASGNFQRAQTQLSDTTVQNEQTKRDELDAAIVSAKALQTAYAQALANMGNPNLVNNPRSVDLTAGVFDPDVKYDMQVTQAQLNVLDDLIKRTADPVVRQGFVDLRQVTIGTALNRVSAQQALLATTPVQLQQLRAQLGSTPLEQWNRDANFHVDVSRTLRSGIVVSPFFDYQYTFANYVGKSSWDPNFGGYGVKPLFQGRLGFDVTVPMARGRQSVGAAEIAARHDVEAARLTVLHQKSQSVLSTVQAYWAVRAAGEQIDVLKRSVDLQNELLRMTRALIAANERARADEARILASANDAQARLAAAERQYTEARIALARTMGVALADARAIPIAADPFPRPAESLQVDTGVVTAFAVQAAEQRFDRQAALKLTESGRVLQSAAMIDTRPQLDVDLSGWGTTLHEDNPGWGSWVFRSGSAGVQFERPFKNNVALGRLDQSVASVRQSEIDAGDLQRRIVLGVTTDIASLQAAAERLKWAEEAVRNYDQTIINEQAKLKGGDSTLLDTILTEQQTTSARLALVAARQDYANLVAQLRFDSASLIQDAAGKSSVTLETLVAVPAGLVRR